MTVRVLCTNPDCRQAYHVQESHLGRRVVCKKCGADFRLSSNSEEQPPATSADKPAEPVVKAVRLELPAKIGRFEIRGRLGAGAFGVVYRAYDPMLDREVALKVPHAGKLDSERAKQRFLREAKAAAKLRHPNIVPVYEAGREGETYYIASAFIEGQTLQDAMEAGGSTSANRPSWSATWPGPCTMPIEQGVVHRDVKPANIMLDGKGDPLLMDFGLARFEERRESKLTHDGTVLGTPAYMPPEQAAGKLDEVGPASDQYSLGVILYELLCGSDALLRPAGVGDFAGDQPGAAAHRARRTRRNPEGLGDDLPEGDVEAAGASLRQLCRRWPRTCGVGWPASRSRHGGWDCPSGLFAGAAAIRWWRRFRRRRRCFWFWWLSWRASAMLLHPMHTTVLKQKDPVPKQKGPVPKAALAGEAAARREAERAAREAETEKSRAESALAGEIAARHNTEQAEREAETEKSRAESALTGKTSARREAETEKSRRKTASSRRNGCCTQTTSIRPSGNGKPTTLK